MKPNSPNKRVPRRQTAHNVGRRLKTAIVRANCKLDEDGTFTFRVYRRAVKRRDRPTEVCAGQFDRALEMGTNGHWRRF
jgi:hypothetical protein